jgi:alkylation response protein AidB-like acyl-CoA dehydrogenase
MDVVAAVLGAEQLGGAARALEQAVEYAGVRHQFGRPIGSFQAIKHICADMLVDVEFARSAASHALWAADHDAGELPVAAALAQAYCSDAYVRVAGQNIQVHGGIGFTWEHPAHLYLKRAKSSQLLFGDAAWHRAKLAELVGV